MAALDLKSGSAKAKQAEETKERLEFVIFSNDVFLEMLKDFHIAKPNEAICWCSGTAKNGKGVLNRYWGCRLEYANPVGAKTRSDWLLKFVGLARELYPETNLFAECHSHPIGSQLSAIDEAGLLALTDWNREIYWVMIACDFRLGSYFVQNGEIEELRWRVEREWLEDKQLEMQTTSTTSSSSWVKKLFEKLRRQE